MLGGPLASLSAILFPLVMSNRSFWCVLQWMIANSLGDFMASNRSRISGPCLIGALCVVSRPFPSKWSHEYGLHGRHMMSLCKC